MAEGSEPESSGRAAATELGQIHAIMERAVKRGPNRRKVEPVSQIGVDDKAFRKGHSYLTLVNDLHRGRVLCVAEDRRQSSLDGFWETLTWNKSAALTRWRWICGTLHRVGPRARTRGGSQDCFDKFHIVQHLGDAVDRVRRKENRTLRASGDDRLTGTHHDWLRNPAAMEPKDRRAFSELRKSGLKTARA